MRKAITGIVVFISALVLTVFFGCSAFMDAVTPCPVDLQAAKYADADSTGWLPFTTLLDAERIDAKMDYKHEVNQMTIDRLLEDDKVLYGFLKDTQQFHIKGAREFQQRIFSPTGPIGVLIPTIFGGTLGALLIPRLGEKKKIEQAKEEGKKEANNKA